VLQTSVDKSNASKMAQSGLTLARTAGDLRTVVAALKLVNQVLEVDAATAAQNHNYLGKKQEELSQRLQAADAEEQERLLVLHWGLGS
jgi:hypothetical protein